MKLTSTVGFVCALIVSPFSAHSSDSNECNTDTAQIVTDQALPERSGPRTRTSGVVPHVQVDVDPVDELTSELLRFAFTLPGLEKRPTIVSLPGAIGMWLADDVPVKQPKTIIRGREFAHIHTDGSLHAPFPLARALELTKKGWGERHPWADRFDGWEGLVMLYSASNQEELKVLVQLVSESYNFVTGRNASVSGC